MRLLLTIMTTLASFWMPGWIVSPAEASGRIPDMAVAITATRPDPQDLSIFEQKIQIARQEKTLAAQTLAVARSFLGTPYAHGTLETEGEEKVVVNLHELDCWTFVENSLAIALSSRAAEPGFDTLLALVQQLRYWGGTVDGYASRIHYFSGWLLQAGKIGYLRDLSEELGGLPYPANIGYMTAHPQKYPALQDPKTFRQLQQVEARLNRHAWYYIPENRIARIESQLRDGDLIALTSWKKDLDIAHQGFAVWQNGRVHLLHASSLGKRVVLSTQPLAEYVRSQKGQSGIMVARLASETNE